MRSISSRFHAHLQVRSLSFMTLLLFVSAPASSSAQQPLTAFLEAAQTRALDVREARAALDQARSQVDEARARLLPSVQAQGVYQRNEFEAAFGNPVTGAQIVVQPRDALTAQFTLNVPLIDIGAWSAFFQQEAAADATDAQLALADQNVKSSVVQIWHQLVATRALVTAAERNVETNESNRAAAAARVEVGVSPQLELSRAEAELARARQTLAEAHLQAVLTARNLTNLTGLEPTAEEASLDDDMHEENGLEEYMGGARNLPAVRAAREAERAANIANDTAWTALLPSISAFARENGANYGGFAGQNWYYTLGVQATWILDFQRPATINTRAAAADAAVVRTERAIQQQETAIFDAWQRVASARVRAEAAAAALAASERAASDAQARFESGAGTQLDQIQAQRDLFQAEVSRIQAIADLKVARMTLRIRAGLTL